MRGRWKRLRHFGRLLSGSYDAFVGRFPQGLRPLVFYPSVAFYLGAGDIHDLGNTALYPTASQELLTRNE